MKWYLITSRSLMKCSHSASETYTMMYVRMKCVTVVLWLCIVSVSVESSRRQRGEIFPVRKITKIPVGKSNDPDGPGKPLFLTPLIQAGKIKRAQHLSRVKPDIGDIPSYSGFLTTNKTCGNNLFFWFFPAREDWDNAPLVLCLQGGPGSSSMFGLFEENGPFNHFPEGLEMRNFSWNVKNNLLFIDQPVGTGYSFTKKGCYVTNQVEVGIDLYSALIQFLQLFPNLQQNKFFITGESFAGHYIPAIGYTIHQNNPSAKLKINLAGMMIGDGWTDPREQINYGDYLYQAGLIDDEERDQFYTYQNLFVQQIDSYDWEGAYDSWNEILGLFDEYAGVNVYNYLPQPPDRSDWDVFIQAPEVRKSIHVGNLEYDEQSDEVYSHLTDNMVQSVKPYVEVLLNNGYPMVFYVGQVDVICAYPMVINFLRSLNWTGQAEYLNATRRQWMEGDELAGYFKTSANLADVLVRDAGHMVPSDQPYWAYQLVNRFTQGGIQALLGYGSQDD